MNRNIIQRGDINFIRAHINDTLNECEDGVPSPASRGRDATPVVYVLTGEGLGGVEGEGRVEQQQQQDFPAIGFTGLQFEGQKLG